MSDHSHVHNWLVAGGSSDEGRQFLLDMLTDKYLVSIFQKKAKYQEQIIREALSYRTDFRKPKEGKLRSEFTFLNSPDCPFELKVLAADKLTAHQNYKDAHKALFDCKNNQEQYLTAKRVVENFKNNQAIWKELDHYQKTGKILGKHPVFDELNRIVSLRQSSPVELVEARSRIQENIWRIESELKKGNKPHLQVERENRLQLRRVELAEIERLIESYR